MTNESNPPPFRPLFLHYCYIGPLTDVICYYASLLQLVLQIIRITERDLMTLGARGTDDEIRRRREAHRALVTIPRFRWPPVDPTG